MKKLTKKILLDARELIATEYTWIQGEPIVHADDMGEDWDKAPVCYCLGGAIAQAAVEDANRLYDIEFGPLLREFVTLAELPLNPTRPWTMDWSEIIYDFNDGVGREHSEVLAVLDKVIALVEDDEDQ